MQSRFIFIRWKDYNSDSVNYDDFENDKLKLYKAELIIDYLNDHKEDEDLINEPNIRELNNKLKDYIKLNVKI